MDLIELRDVRKTYRHDEVEISVLRGINLTVRRGELLALTGASGSGKSTLMNIIGCLDRASAGQYFFEGQDVTRLSATERALIRNRKLGFIFQAFNLMPRTSALDNVLMPLAYTAAHFSQADKRERAISALEKVGLADRLTHHPGQLSGGQQQRVAIARALINQPTLLCADEPTGNLDSRTTEDILALLQKLNRDDGMTIIMVTHDPDVARHARRIVHLRDGLIEQLPALS